MIKNKNVMMLEKHLVQDVFTPTKPARETFVERDTINDQLVSAIKTPGKQIIVYGHSGSGKTTLVENKLTQTYENHVTTRCMIGVNFDQIVLDAFDQLAPFFVSESSMTTKSSTSLGMESTYQSIKASFKFDESADSTLKQQRALPPQLTPQVLARFIGEAKCCWVIEDFHKVDDTDKKKLSQAMKVFMDMADRYSVLKIIAIGAVDTARQVVEYDREMRNRVSEIHVPLMKTEELQEIITKGERLLNISIPYDIKQQIVRYSSGLAAVCHQLCLNICFAANITETVTEELEINQDIFSKAVQAYIDDASDTLKSAFDKAFRRTRIRKFDNGRLIIQALQSFGEAGAVHGELLNEIKRYVPEYRASNLTSYMKSLMSAEKGELVRCDSSSGKFLFTDPIYLAFASLVFKGKDEQGDENAAHGKDFDALFAQALERVRTRLNWTEFKMNLTKVVSDTGQLSLDIRSEDDPPT